jgi:TolB-like protein/Tfp pilus assembly protein PilF
MEVLKISQKISKRTPRTASESGGRVYKFRSFLLDTAERVLRCDEKNVPLTPKVFDTLVVLVERAGRLVTKESLLAEVWPDTFVEEANLSVNIATLRKALGEIAGEHQYIQTISKRGYRFVANVVEVERETRPVAIDQPQSAVIAKKQSTLDQYQGLTSLAVLPFDNGSADPNAEYLSDGITESIINSISQLQGLRVVARNTVFRYKAKGVDPEKVGRELGVCAVLYGRILQLGDRVVIRAELVDVLNGWQIWGEEYQVKFQDILTVQEEISEAISGKLKLQLTREEKERLGKRNTGNAEAFKLYLKGRYYWNKYTHEGLEKALEYFRQAIDIDPVYALAYAGIADSHFRLANQYLAPRLTIPKAKAAAMRALEIDPTLPEAHASLGILKMRYDCDWQGAELELKQAISLNPSYVAAHQWYGAYFQAQRRFDEALHHFSLAQELDPLSTQVTVLWGMCLWAMRLYDEALEKFREAIAMNPHHYPAHLSLALTHAQLKNFPEAIEEFKKAGQLDDSRTIMGYLAHVYAASGKRDEAQRILEEMLMQRKERYCSAYAVALVYAALSEDDLAFEWLAKAHEEHDDHLGWGVASDPRLDSLRGDPRFNELLSRVGLANLIIDSPPPKLKTALPGGG